jgi:hypothetical protein
VNAANAGVNWTVASNRPWINVSPNGGTGSGSFAISVNPAGQTGNLAGEVTVTPAGSPAVQTIQVYLSVLGASSPPFGVIDTPADGATVQGAIPVTGWALDDLQVNEVRIYRNPVGTEVQTDPNGIFIGTAVFTPGARPDVAGRFSNFPLRERGGWGLQILTNMLPNSAGSGPRGNGSFTLRAVATDAEGNATLLGTRAIVVNNLTAAKPFGTIDTPGQGGIISGPYYVVFGWALTPGTAMIPTDGSTMMVYIDGVPVGRPTYNQRRQDIVDLFPGYTNAEGAVGYFELDTRTLTNGMHSIAWSVTDNQGRTEGIGSRYFFVQN